MTTWADERSLQCCHLQLSVTCFRTSASSSPYGETRPEHWVEGVAFTAASSLAAGLWRRRLQHCLNLVGPPEDLLRLRLSLVPGRTRPCFGGGHRLRCRPLGPYQNGGLVIVAIVQLEWGSSSSSNTHLFWAEPKTNNFDINKLLRLGNEGA